MGYKKLQLESYFPDEEITRYGFISHMEDYIKQLLKNPETAKVDDYLTKFGIGSPQALMALVKRSDPSDENSAVLIRTEKIKPDEENAVEGAIVKDKFYIKYKLPRKDYMKKMRNLFIKMFENHIVDNNQLNEGAWGKGILDNDAALDYQSTFGKEILNKFVIDIQGCTDSGNLWAKLGVLIDFLKKYKDDELQVTDEYTSTVMFARQKLDQLYRDKNFINSWENSNEMESKLKHLDKQLSDFLYEKNILNVPQQVPHTSVPQQQPTFESKLNEEENCYERPLSSCANMMGMVTPGGQYAEILDKWCEGVNNNENGYKPHIIDEDGEGGGEGGTMAGMGGATSCGASSGQFVQPLFGKPIKKKTVYLTQEQLDYLKEEAELDTRFGDFGYDVPFGNGKLQKKDPAYNHKNMMKKSFEGE